MNHSWDRLIQGIKERDVRAMSRLITRVENRECGWRAAMSEIYSMAGESLVIGITGSPGAGKSTLTCEIARELSKKSRSVGIIAVDPSSPFSGGALLGDRLRMQEIFTIPEIFIRSMATRGMLGGLCQGARDVVRIMSAFGKDIILIETVGVGQDEIEIVRTADQVMVVLVPGQGDGIQAIKAGVMEIADLYVINKSDRPGADEVVADVQGMLSLSTASWESLPPVMKTSAIKREGVRALVETLLYRSLETKEKKNHQEFQVKEEILSLMEREVFRHIRNRWEQDERLKAYTSLVMEKRSDPYSIVKQMLEDQAYLLIDNN